MFPPKANFNLEITATEFEHLVRDWIFRQCGELTSVEVIRDAKVETYGLQTTYPFELS
ncbi:hypothetical protein ABIA55_000760 [Pseudomonas frederiksbergensis]